MRLQDRVAVRPEGEEASRSLCPGGGWGLMVERGGSPPSVSKSTAEAALLAVAKGTRAQRPRRRFATALALRRFSHLSGGEQAKAGLPFGRANERCCPGFSPPLRSGKEAGSKTPPPLNS